MQRDERAPSVPPAELIQRRRPWRQAEHLEVAVFAYLDWWNHRRLHGKI